LFLLEHLKCRRSITYPKSRVKSDVQVTLCFKVRYVSHMRTLAELGNAVAARRKALKLCQSEVAARSGLTRESLVRLERGQLTEFGSRKLLAKVPADISIGYRGRDLSQA
jgi:DNA-binding XRE family transcriptional regulator